MKSKLYFALAVAILSIAFISCAEKTAEKKIEKTVVKKSIDSKPISVLNKGFHKAFFSPNSEQLIASSENDKGLIVYDFKNDVMEHLNSKDGAGINPLFTNDGKYVVFQSHAFVNRRRMTSLFFQDIKEKVIKSIVENKRDIKLLAVNNRDVIFLEGDIIKSFNLITGEETNNPKNINIAFTDNNLNLVSYNNGMKKTLNPQGEGNYIWVSISPDGKNIVYNKTGKGTFICDLSGKTVTDLGRLHASKWSGDSKWIIGMDDHDDGYKYTKSDILMISVDGKTQKNLTENSDVIALNPDISSDNSRVIYHNEEGRVYFMNLK